MFQFYSIVHKLEPHSKCSRKSPRQINWASYQILETRSQRNYRVSIFAFEIDRCQRYNYRFITKYILLGQSDGLQFSWAWTWIRKILRTYLQITSTKATYSSTSEYFQYFNLFVTSKNETTNSPIDQCTNLKSCI